jgi:vacuolar-type H+-ATPase subunit E/Vma4
MAYYNEDQLKRYFEKAIERVAKGKLASLQQEIDLMFYKELSKVKDELQVKHDLERQSKIRDLQVAHQEKLNLIGVEYDQKLISARQEMVKEIFDDVKQMLLEFVKTSDYETLMASNIQGVVQEHPDVPMFFTIGALDRVLNTLITTHYPNANITLGEIELGGMMLSIPSLNIEYDFTMDQKLRDAYQQFLETSTLFIRS